MKRTLEFPPIYRVVYERGGVGWWWRLQRLELGAFLYKWRTIGSYFDEPTKEKVAAAIGEDDLREEAKANPERYFLVPEASAA